MIRTEALIAKFEEAEADQFGYIYGKTHEWWTKEKQAAYKKEYADNPDRKMSCEYGGKWIGHYVTDCSGLFTWAFKELGGTMYHGSNTMWNKWCSDKGSLKNGKRTDGKTLKPGTAVFTYNKSTGIRGHVGLYIGNGTVIEAQGAKVGVIRSKLTLAKWVEWGELTGVDYSGSGETAQPADSGTVGGLPLPTLRRGDKGEYVTLAQTSLAQRGYDLGSYGIDGDFGRATEQAVKQFQQDWGLSVDGVIGPATWAVLTTAPTKEKKYKVIISGLDLTQAKAMMNNYPGSTMQEE